MCPFFPVQLSNAECQSMIDGMPHQWCQFLIRCVGSGVDAIVAEAKDKEAELALEEALMDMRRASDKDGLMSRQDEAMRLVHDVQTGYRDFHAQSLERIGMHPGAVAAELEVMREEAGATEGAEGGLTFFRQRKWGEKEFFYTNTKSNTSLILLTG